MDKSSRILISGAGVAGLTCAIWLARKGFNPVVIEKSPTVRADGFIVSLSHASYHLAKELDLMDKITARNTGIRESSYHDRHGRAMLTLNFRDLFVGVDVMQIMRDDLEDILYEEVRHLVELRLATTMTKVEQRAGVAEVTFSDGQTGEFDVVIGADGIHSNTRSLTFPNDTVGRRYMGLFSAAYRLPNILGLRDRFENHMERNRYMCVYTTRDGDLACLFIWQWDESAAPDVEMRQAVLREHYIDAPTLVDKVIGGFPGTDPMYMDPLIQIEMPHWSRSNTVLLGDAAHCLTLLSGQGASSAFWGACVLAQGLVDHSMQDAFGHYESTLKPVMDNLQPATRLAAKWYIPRTPLRYVMRDCAMRYLPNPFFQRYFRNKYSKA